MTTFDDPPKWFGRLLSICTIWFALSLAAIFGSLVSVPIAQILVTVSWVFLAIGLIGVLLTMRKEK